MRDIITKDCQIRFGKFIRDAREKREMSQSEIAEQLGIHQSYVSKMENGERQVDLVVAMRICYILNIDLNDFTKEFI